MQRSTPPPASTAASSAVLKNARNTASRISDSISNEHQNENGHHHHHRSGTGFHSEHGHSLSRISPMAIHSGASVATFFTGLFQTILAIGTLGASITFNYVLSNASPVDGSNTLDTPSGNTGRVIFSAATVQLFLSVSWLLFLLALAFASLGSTLLTFFKKHWVRDWDGEHGRTSQVTVQWYAVIASALMGGLVIAAFALLCLVVVAYSPAVGWIALGFTGFFGFIIVLAIGNQVPWPWLRQREPQREELPKSERTHTATV
jgi:hypothetical protein